MKLETERALVAALERARTILGNMAQEQWSWMGPRWPIHHEPLRADARALLPDIDAALKLWLDDGDSLST